MSCPLLFAQTNEGLYFKTAISGASADQENAIFLGSQSQSIDSIPVEEFPIQGKVTKIAALLGVISLKLNKYAIIANIVEETGRLNGGHIIYKVAQHSVVPIRSTARLVDSDDVEYLKLLETQLNNATLFFSYTYDLTNSMQRNEKIGNLTSYNWENVDTRFFWNHYITDPLRTAASKDKSIGRFIQPVIYGYAKVVDTIFNSTPIAIGLITRRSRFRAGTRYFRRGVDEDGNVGNYNENEQILVVQNTKDSTCDVFAFLQTRGSVPVYWAEINNLKYKPNLVLGDNSTLQSTKKHFDQQVELYGDNYLVNLVNQKGHELPVKNSYENAVDQLNNPKLHYVYFDFHHECRKMQWHRVKLLIDQLSEMGLSNDDVFHKIVDQNGITTVRVVTRQGSTVRTNCMDCLDRTNVVQSVLAHWVLQKEFEISNVTNEGNLWESDKSLLSIFQNLWADNADAVSVSYSGTGALKTDFTRTGKRTRVGAFNDFINSASRYYQNNLTDGPRQDSYDLFLGNFKPYEYTMTSPFLDKRPFGIQFLPTILYAAFTVLLATIFFPKNYFTSKKNLLFFLVSLIMVILSLKVIFQNGMQYVNWPKVVDVGFLTSNTTYSDKTKSEKGFKYIASSKYVKPVSSKKE
ncbi:Phosphoinositide phosphatase sac1 [Monosporozyma unispora]|nr:Phosphoinositide phosphatase sac1 [Kazachstania unispora]